MEKAGTGSKVKVHYTGKLTDGSVFDSSLNRGPLEFTMGDGHMIRGFESAVEGMTVGESKTVTIPDHEAYGPRREDLVVCVQRSQIPPDIRLELGLGLEVKQSDGTIHVVVTGMDDNSVTLDANHPLSGKDLVFDIQLVEIA